MVFGIHWQTFAPESLVSYDFVQEKWISLLMVEGCSNISKTSLQPVKEAVSVGNNVWHVKRFHRGGAIPDTDLYLIRRTKDDGRVVEVDHQQNETWVAKLVAVVVIEEKIQIDLEGAGRRHNDGDGD